MPRASSSAPMAAAPENAEDWMDEEHAENWETVSEGFGTKIEWTVGRSFIGTFDGVKIVELDDKEGGFTNAPSATFHDNMGEKFWCWLPHQLKLAVEEGKLSEGRVCFIKCEGEQQTKRGLNPVKTFTVKLKPV